MIKINCDIGERGPENQTDLALMSHIHIANIACGGHAGDKHSVEVFRKLAVENGVEVAGHLSYPDREDFGRRSLDIPIKELLISLDEQYQLIADVKLIKFHGALYNDSVVNRDLAKALASWLKTKGIAEVIAPRQSQMAETAAASGIRVLAEAFAERRYTLHPQTSQPVLVSRSKDYASIRECDAAVVHTKNIVSNHQVEVIIENSDGSLERKMVPLEADTICIHSDSVISLELASALSTLLKDTT